MEDAGRVPRRERKRSVKLANSTPTAVGNRGVRSTRSNQGSRGVTKGATSSGDGLLYDIDDDDFGNQAIVFTRNPKSRDRAKPEDEDASDFSFEVAGKRKGRTRSKGLRRERLGKALGVSVGNTDKALHAEANGNGQILDPKTGIREESGLNSGNEQSGAELPPSPAADVTAGNKLSRDSYMPFKKRRLMQMASLEQPAETPAENGSAVAPMESALERKEPSGGAQETSKQGDRASPALELAAARTRSPDRSNGVAPSKGLALERKPGSPFRIKIKREQASNQGGLKAKPASLGGKPFPLPRPREEDGRGSGKVAAGQAKAESQGPEAVSQGYPATPRLEEDDVLRRSMSSSPNLPIEATRPAVKSLPDSAALHSHGRSTLQLPQALSPSVQPPDSSLVNTVKQKGHRASVESGKQLVNHSAGKPILPKLHKKGKASTVLSPKVQVSQSLSRGGFEGGPSTSPPSILPPGGLASVSSGRGAAPARKEEQPPVVKEEQRRSSSQEGHTTRGNTVAGEQAETAQVDTRKALVQEKDAGQGAALEGATVGCAEKKEKPAPETHRSQERRSESHGEPHLKSELKPAGLGIEEEESGCGKSDAQGPVCKERQESGMTERSRLVENSLESPEVSHADAIGESLSSPAHRKDVEEEERVPDSAPDTSPGQQGKQEEEGEIPIPGFASANLGEADHVLKPSPPLTEGVTVQQQEGDHHLQEQEAATSAGKEGMSQMDTGVAVAQSDQQRCPPAGKQAGVSIASPERGEGAVKGGVRVSDRSSSAKAGGDDRAGQPGIAEGSRGGQGKDDALCNEEVVVKHAEVAEEDMLSEVSDATEGEAGMELQLGRVQGNRRVREKRDEGPQGIDAAALPAARWSKKLNGMLEGAQATAEEADVHWDAEGKGKLKMVAAESSGPTVGAKSGSGQQGTQPDAHVKAADPREAGKQEPEEPAAMEPPALTSAGLLGGSEAQVPELPGSLKDEEQLKLAGEGKVEVSIKVAEREVVEEEEVDYGESDVSEREEEGEEEVTGRSSGAPRDEILQGLQGGVVEEAIDRMELDAARGLEAEGADAPVRKACASIDARGATSGGDREEENGCRGRSVGAGVEGEGPAPGIAQKGDQVRHAAASETLSEIDREAGYQKPGSKDAPGLEPSTRGLSPRGPSPPGRRSSEVEREVGTVEGGERDDLFGRERRVKDDSRRGPSREDRGQQRGRSDNSRGREESWHRDRDSRGDSRSRSGGGGDSRSRNRSRSMGTSSRRRSGWDCLPSGFSSVDDAMGAICTGSLDIGLPRKTDALLRLVDGWRHVDRREERTSRSSDASKGGRREALPARVGDLEPPSPAVASPLLSPLNPGMAPSLSPLPFFAKEVSPRKLLARRGSTDSGDRVGGREICPDSNESHSRVGGRVGGDDGGVTGGKAHGADAGNDNSGSGGGRDELAEGSRAERQISLNTLGSTTLEGDAVTAAVESSALSPGPVLHEEQPAPTAAASAAASVSGEGPPAEETHDRAKAEAVPRALSASSSIASGSESGPGVAPSLSPLASPADTPAAGGVDAAAAPLKQSAAFTSSPCATAVLEGGGPSAGRGAAWEKGKRDVGADSSSPREGSSGDRRGKEPGMFTDNARSEASSPRGLMFRATAPPIQRMGFGRGGRGGREGAFSPGAPGCGGFHQGWRGRDDRYPYHHPVVPSAPRDREEPWRRRSLSPERRGSRSRSRSETRSRSRSRGRDREEGGRGSEWSRSRRGRGGHSRSRSRSPKRSQAPGGGGPSSASPPPAASLTGAAPAEWGRSWNQRGGGYREREAPEREHPHHFSRHAAAGFIDARHLHHHHHQGPPMAFGGRMHQPPPMFGRGRFPAGSVGSRIAAAAAAGFAGPLHHHHFHHPAWDDFPPSRAAAFGHAGRGPAGFRGVGGMGQHGPPPGGLPHHHPPHFQPGPQRMTSAPLRSTPNVVHGSSLMDERDRELLAGARGGELSDVEGSRDKDKQRR